MQEICTIAFILLAIYGVYVWLTGQDPASKMGAEVSRLVEANKNKTPILYLHSFASGSLQLADIKNLLVSKPVAGTEAYWKDAGHMVTNYLRVLAPTRELANPDKRWRLRPWAPSRPESVAVSNDNWQQQVLAWLPDAPLVVIQLDSSEGLAWELEKVVQLVRPTRVLLVLPPTDAEYDQIRALAQRFFPAPFPEDLPESRLMTFTPNWQPLPLQVPGQVGMWQSLEPIFLQNGYEAPNFRGAWGYGPKA